MSPSSFVNLFADDTQGIVASSGYHLITTTSDATNFQIPLSTEEEGIEENDEDEDEGGDEEEDEEKPIGDEVPSSPPLRVAFVKPSFTYAAYQLNGFYNFYQKARDLPDGITNVTTDLNLLTVRVPEETYLTYRDDPSDTPRIPSQQNYYEKLRELAEQKANSQNLDMDIADITDKEVHEGDIFDSDGNNAYDILFLFHQEYVTQAEYDNLKKFVVQDGGTIVFNDANIFTVQVKYDSVDNTVMLVRGHGWAYDDGSSGSRGAWRAESERWFNENRQWVGSNFIEIPSNDKDVTFSNDPFNYTHSEEQIVTNPNDEIIFDFGVMEDVTYEIDDNEIDDMQHFPGFGKVAAYEMTSGKGKVINIGIFAHKLEDNEAFLDFYDEEILPRALD